jgi:fructokinase
MIVCCGEALVDFLPAKTETGANAYVAKPGGAPFNVAVALARLGASAGFFGALSTDAFGAMLLATLAANGVDVEFAARVARPSTLAFVSFADGEARYAFFDEGSAGRMLTENDLPAFPTSVTALHFGSFSLAEEPCGSAFEALMQREQRDRVITLDPNVRPEMIRNRDGYAARIDRLVEMSDIVRLSRADLAYLAPGEAFAAVAARWLERGAKLVVLTKGAEGAEARSRATSAEVTAPTITPIDTVGAGDAFTGALLAHLEGRRALSKAGLADLGGHEIRDALMFAANAAAVSVSRAGADPPWLRELV